MAKRKIVMNLTIELTADRKLVAIVNDPELFAEVLARILAMTREAMEPEVERDYVAAYDELSGDFNKKAES